MRAVEIHHHHALVVGAGIAGLSAALGLGRAAILTDEPPGTGGSSPWAQGGMAAAVGRDDSPQRHAADTARVAGGLAVEDLVELVTAGGPEAVRFLEEAGARFDRRSGDGHEVALGREAGHTRDRIVHAAGDSTGAEIMNALARAIDGRPKLQVFSGRQAVDLVFRRSSVVGVLAWHGDRQRLEVHLANAVILATGGYGHAFARTSTPAQVSGAGIAMAARAGAAVADMEFVQFHPTALDVDADPVPLLTEALRGEGATLVDRHGDRFMFGRHDDAELAPRDVVARAVYQALQAGDRPALDARTALGDKFPDRFPTVFTLARAHGLDPRHQVLPIAPAAHYTMGGVVVDRWGRTTVSGLWAVGEVGSSGLHGANRLASNSLLEGVVLGRRAAQSVGSHLQARAEPSIDPASAEPRSGAFGELEVPMRPEAHSPNGLEERSGVAEVRRLLWHGAGVVRSAEGLQGGLAELDDLLGVNVASNALDNAATVAKLVLEAALDRTESRGAHARSDFPSTDPGQQRRSLRRPDPVARCPLAEVAEIRPQPAAG